MQQHPDPTRTQRRTQPALPGITVSTAPIVPASPSAPRYTSPIQRGRRRYYGLRAILLFLLLGVLIEVCLLALFPLLVHSASATDPVRLALLNLFPWTAQLFWTTNLPFISQLLAHLPGFDPASTQGNNNLLLVLLFVICLLSFLAARTGTRVARERLAVRDERVIFWTILCLTTLFALTLLVAPTGLHLFSRDMLLYGIYGHVVVVYRANPYIAPPASFTGLLDPLQTIIGTRTTAVTPYAPLWTDISVLMTLVAHSSIANLLASFRILGLLAHLANVALIWTIVTKLKAEQRIAATLLYAWNPLVLLLSVTMMHQDVIVVMFLLVAVLFFLRNSPTLGWVSVLFAALIQPFCFLLLPLFLRFMGREARIMTVGQRIVWWVGMSCISLLVVGLAYAPYWQGWGISGILTNIRQVFWQDTAVNSLDAALLHFPVRPPEVLLWLLYPHHWSLFALAFVALFLLVGIWLTDAIEYMLLFSSCILLILFALMPTYWPWLLLPAFAFALISGNARTSLLGVALMLGAVASYYSLLWPTAPFGQGIVSVGVPLLLWGWLVFFTSTWQMTHAKENEQSGLRVKGVPTLSRPSVFSRPSRPGRN